MAGLSDLNFATGAQAGANIGNSILNGIEQRKNSEQSRSLRDADLKMRNERHSMDKDRHEMDMQNAHLKRANFLLQNREAVNRLLARQANAIYMSGRGEDGQFKPDEVEQEILKFYPNLSSEYLLSDDYGKAIDFSKNVIKSRRPGMMNTPEGHAAFDILNPEVNAAAADSRKRKTIGLYPGKKENTFAVEFDVDGEPDPMTVQRGRDNEVLQIPVERMVQRVAAGEQLRNLFSSERGLMMLMRNGGIEPPKESERYSDVYKDELTGMTGQKNLSNNKFTPFGGQSGSYQPSVYGKYMTDLKAQGYSDEDADALAQKWMVERKSMPRDDAILGMAQDLMKNDGGTELAPYIKSATEAYDSFKNPQPKTGTAPQAALDALKANPGLRDQFQAKYGYLPEMSPNQQASGEQQVEPEVSPPAETPEPTAGPTPEQQGLIERYNALRNTPRSRGVPADVQQEMSEIKELLDYYGVDIPEPTSSGGSGGRSAAASSMQASRKQEERMRIAALERKYGVAPVIASR